MNDETSNSIQRDSFGRSTLYNTSLEIAMPSGAAIPKPSQPNHSATQTPVASEPTSQNQKPAS
jgi:hypothetical protein